jgi:hypothetical protein
MIVTGEFLTSELELKHATAAWKLMKDRAPACCLSLNDIADLAKNHELRQVPGWEPYTLKMSIRI